MIVAEHRHAGVLASIDGLQRAPEIARARPGPGREQRRGDVVRPARVSGRELRARRGVLTIGDRTRRERKARETVAGVAGDQPIGEREGVDPVAVRQRRGEGALDEIDVAGIGAQGLAKIERGACRVAIVAGDDRREVIASLRLPDFERSRTGVDDACVGRSGQDEKKRGRGEERATAMASGYRVGQGRMFPLRDGATDQPPYSKIVAENIGATKALRKIGLWPA